MFDLVLKRMRASIRARAYVMTLHAEEEMTDEAWTVYDVEQGILTGKILERQQDRVTGERKYRIRGNALGGDEIEVVAKFGPTGRLVVLTVYRP